MGGQKIITCDIDGVLNNYPETLLNYAFNEHGAHIENLAKFKSEFPLEYKKIKSAYRYSDSKHKAQPRTKTVTLINDLAAKGHTVVVFTSRPFDDYPGMFDLTESWLGAIGLNFDSLHSKTKSNFDKLNPVCHFDDQLSHIMKIYSSKSSFFLFQKAINMWGELPHSNIHKITEEVTAHDILSLIMTD